MGMSKTCLGPWEVFIKVLFHPSYSCMVDSLSKLISRFEDKVEWLTFKLVAVG